MAWLMEDARKVSVSLSSMHSTRKQKLSRSRKAARAAVAAGHPGKALRRLAHCDTAPLTDDTLSAFQALHPEGRDVPDPPNDLPALPRLSKPVVWNAIRWLLQTAAGPSGLRAEYLVMAYGNGCSGQLLSILQSIVDVQHRTGYATLG